MITILIFTDFGRHKITLRTERVANLDALDGARSTPRILLRSTDGHHRGGLNPTGDTTDLDALDGLDTSEDTTDFDGLDGLDTTLE